ncbi:MAG: hypothetical protein FWD17_13190 [Polyangiaceae bacterium]|nr:hypothetical protein [Polyangiaceae bacterium]
MPTHADATKNDGKSEEQEERKKKSFITREAILAILSDEEVAKLSAAEARPLIQGDDYVDLEHPEKGVLKVHAGDVLRPGTLVPRNAVRDKTWSAIVAMLAR